MCRGHASAAVLAVIAAAALAASLPAQAQPAGFPPFSLAEIDFTRDCGPNEAFERLLSLLGRPAADNPADHGPAFDEPLHNAVSGETWQRLLFDRAADWHGLRLRGVELHHGIERGPVNYRLLFEDPPEKVREVWNARGWNLPPIEGSRDVEGLAGYASVALGRDAGGGGSVTCFRD